MKIWLQIAGAILVCLSGYFSLPAAMLLACFPLYLAWRHPRRVGLITLFLISLTWAFFQVQSALEQQRFFSPRPGDGVYTGEVTGLPRRFEDEIEFLFRADTVPGFMRVRWRTGKQVEAGDRWKLDLKVRAPRGRSNFQGWDQEQDWFARHISGLAQVQGPAERLGRHHGLSGFESVRQSIGKSLQSILTGYAGAPLVKALAIADRSDLDARFWRLTRKTGTGHLLAVSGLHIGLAAAFGFGMLRFLLAFAPFGLARWPPRLLAMAGSLLCAATYAGLTGFSTSAQRALVLLLGVQGSALSRRNIVPGHVLLAAFAWALVSDPLDALRPGLWLSFIAVMALMACFTTRTEVTGRLQAIITAQVAVVCATLPLGMLWFQQGGVAGLLANLLAIPWVALVTLPLTLTGMLLLPAGEAVAGFPLTMAACAAGDLMRLLDWLARWLDPLSWHSPEPTLLAAVLAVAGAILLLALRGMPLRWLALFLYIPILLPRLPVPAAGSARFELLDVGQGLAATFSTRDHSLLYDSGPGRPGHWDLVRGVIQPAFSAQGRAAADVVLISHGDLDHAGGLSTLMRTWPETTFFVNAATRPPGTERCTDRLQFHWNDWRVQALHPGPYLPYLGNDSSCVVSIRGAGTGLLLTGDISAGAERHLLPVLQHHAVLVAPHHGSRSSSSKPFLETVAAKKILIPAGWANRFGFPHPDVVERYRETGAESWSTADCGALRLDFSDRGLIRAQSSRRQSRPPWHWPAAPGCP